MDLIRQIIHAITQVHPTHTLLVHFPVALTSSAFFFVLVAWVRKNETLEKVAFANISLAAISSVVAGIVGYLDNLKFYGGHANNYVAKIVLASILFVLTSTIALVRARKPDLLINRKTRAIYILSYFVAFCLVTVLAFLGGVIIYGM
jgi:uncharacterized membrane protein